MKRWACGVAVAVAVTMAACSNESTSPDATGADTSSVVGTSSTSTTIAETTTTVTTTAAPPTTAPSTTEATTTVETTTPTETTTTEPAITEVRVYFARGERLAIVRRDVSGPAVLGGALSELLEGPSGGELDAGLFTVVPEGTALHGVNLVDGLATVDLSRDFESGGGTMSMQARIAQVVFTATQFDNVDAVQFWLDGAPVEFLGGEGIVFDEPWTRSDVPRELTAGILVEVPQPMATVTSPFVVTGEGDVFEGDFPLWVERDGVRLGDVVVVAAGAWGEWSDFSTTVTVDATAGPIDLVAVDESGCSPPECPEPTRVVVPLTLSD